MEVQSFVQQRALVIAPDDSRHVLEPLDGAIEFTPTMAGLHTVWADDTEDEENRLEALTFAANVDTDESDLDRLADEALDRWIGTGEGDAQTTQTSRGPEKRMNLWPIFLFCVTLFLLGETVLGTRRSVLARLARMVLGRPEPTVD